MNLIARMSAAIIGRQEAARLKANLEEIEAERLEVVMHLNDRNGGDWYHSRADEHGGDWYADAMTDRDVHVRVVE